MNGIERLNKLTEREDTIEEEEEVFIEDDFWDEWFGDVSETEFNDMTELVKTAEKASKENERNYK